MSDIKVYFKSSEDMSELENNSIDLIVTSPPYFEQRRGCEFEGYKDYLSQMEKVVKECYRVLKYGRISCWVISDYYKNGVRYPVVHDWRQMLMDNDFTYIDEIFWIKPMSNISVAGRRTGCFVQSPHPFNYYPRLLTENILIFQKGKMEFEKIRNSVSPEVRRKSKMSISEVGDYLATWWYVNPSSSRVTDSNGRYHSSEFPLNIPLNLIRFYSYVGETVLDPFLGSATTLVACKMLDRNGVGYEKYKVSPDGVNYEEIIRKKLSLNGVELLGEVSIIPKAKNKKIDQWLR